MQTAILVTLCLGIFLPCILGQESCTCTFPNSLSGDTSNKYHFHFDIGAQLLKLDYIPFDNFAEVWDFKNGMLYYTFGKNCKTLKISRPYDPFYMTTPPQCVPKEATFQSTDEDNVLTYQNTKTLQLYRGDRTATYTYKVRMTGSGTCMPRSITVQGVDNDGVTSFTNFVKETDKELDFYENAVNLVGEKCSLDAINATLG